MTSYINTLHEDTLSSYPLTPEAQHMDIASCNDTLEELEKITYTDYVGIMMSIIDAITQMRAAMESIQHTNAAEFIYNHIT